MNFLNNKEWILIGYDWNGGIKYKLNNDINGNRTRKEYYFGKMLFEGQYLNGKRNGKGKEYYHDGNLSFERDYLNGKRNGKGKEYDPGGSLLFEVNI